MGFRGIVTDALESKTNTFLISTASALTILVLTLGSGSAQEVSSPTCEDEICYLDIFDWADPRDPPPESGPYLPQDLTVRPGAIAVWRNMGSDTHTVTSGKTPLEGGAPDGLFDSQLMFVGEEFSYRFEEEGSFRYFCGIHPWMAGQVIVQGIPFEAQVEIVEEEPEPIEEAPIPVEPVEEASIPVEPIEEPIAPDLALPQDEPAARDPDPSPEILPEVEEMLPVNQIGQEIPDPTPEEFVNESQDDDQVVIIGLIVVGIALMGIAVILVMRKR